MEKYDNKITRFDAYLTGAMSADEKTAFEQDLSADAELRREFDEHKQIIFAIQSTCADTDKEFEQAMRGISDSDFDKIIDRKAGDATTHSQQGVAKMVPLKKVISWMSVAAVVVFIAGAAGFQYQSTKMRNKTYDAVFATGFYDSGSRSTGNEEYDQAINMIETDTRGAIEKLTKLYNDTNDNQDKSDYGVALAYAHIKAHDIESAKRIVTELKSKYSNPEVENLDKVLKML